MERIMKKTFILLITLFTALYSRANIIDDPGFASVRDDANLTDDEVGSGWSADLTSGDWRFSGGVATSDRQFSAFYFMQAIDDNGATTGVQDFSFDFDGTNIISWSAPTSQIIYDVYGATDAWTGTFNSSATGPAKTGVTSLLTGVVTGFDVTPTGTFATTVDFGTGYDQIIVRFGSNIGGPATSEVSISNPAIVPEPSAIILVGLALGAVVLFRRRR
jgi:hypothetical protein